MKNILKIQDLERQIRKLRNNSDNSHESVQYEKFKKSRRMIIDNLNTIDKNAAILANQFEQINKKYEQLNAKSEITAKQKPEKTGIANIGNLIDGANYLTSELAKLEQTTRELNDMSSRLLSDYNRAMQDLGEMTAMQKQFKQKIDESEAIVAPKIAELEAEIKKLEAGANKELYAKYKSMRADNIFPVYVHLRGNRCGSERCGMELSLSFIQKLKQEGMLHCENCSCIILADD
ncbi:MAG: hypothetical protein IJ371_00905 [Clostridia bacterium]|nr:hypothetical protein [Clostridia bacterium]